MKRLISLISTEGKTKDQIVEETACALKKYKKAQGRIRVSDEVLKKMSYDHLSYEIEMFTSIVGRMARYKLDVLEKNVMLESFLLHARCLFDFLYPSGDTRPDDVIADDFFEDPTVFRAQIPSSLPIETYLKHRTGKEIAHLTYDRLKVTPEKKVWQVGEVHDQIVGVLEMFFACLTEEQRGWFRMVVSSDGNVGE